MNKIKAMLLFLGILSAKNSLAEDFPDSYIKAQQHNARTIVEVNLDSIQPGKFATVRYVGQLIWIYRRTEADQEYLKKQTTDRLADPDGKNWQASIAMSHKSSSSTVWTQLLMLSQPSIEKMPYRSLKDEFLVIGAWSPHSGCMLRLAESKQRPASWTPFLDQCMGGVWFDVAGKVLKGELSGPPGQPKQPAVFNLFVPPHHYISNSRLAIGLPATAVLPDIDGFIKRNYVGLNATEKLIAAASFNDVAEVKSALEAGAKAESFLPEKGSPFDAAITGSGMDILELLIAKGARPTPNSRHIASFLNRSKVIEIIDRLEKQ